MKEEVEKAAEIIKAGGIILYPTDTIWGIGCDPANDKAVNRIFELKGRDSQKSLILLVSSEQLLNKYVKEIPDICYDLIDLSDKPLTIVYPRGQHVAPGVCAEDGSIAIRFTKDEFCSKLMNKTSCGLISTSANISGEAFPLSLDDISDSIRNGVDYIVNLPLQNKVIKPSQIVKIGLNNEVTIIRK